MRRRGAPCLADAQRAGRLQTELVHLERYPLLAIGEVGQIPLEPEAANVFFHIVAAARNGRLHA
jgi:DNA replication protein DnaC